MGRQRCHFQHSWLHLWSLVRSIHCPLFRQGSGSQSSMLVSQLSPSNMVTPVVNFSIYGYKIRQYFLQNQYSDVTLTLLSKKGAEFLISCKQLKLLRKAGHLQLIQNLVRQCDTTEIIVFFCLDRHCPELFKCAKIQIQSSITNHLNLSENGFH